MDTTPAAQGVHEWVLVLLVTIPAVAGVVGSMLAARHQGRKTRALGTEEHLIARDRIDLMHADIREVKTDVGEVKADIRDLKATDRQLADGQADIRRDLDARRSPLYGLGEGK